MRLLAREKCDHRPIRNKKQVPRIYKSSGWKADQVRAGYFQTSIFDSGFGTRYETLYSKSRERLAQKCTELPS